MTAAAIAVLVCSALLAVSIAVSVAMGRRAVASWRPAVGAAVLAILSTGTLSVAFALVSSTLTLATLGWPEAIARATGLVDAVLLRVIGWIGSVFLTGVGIVVIVLPWLVHSLARWNPLTSPDGTTSGWSHRAPGGEQSGRLSLTDPIPRSHRRRLSSLRVTATGAALVLLVGLSVASLTSTTNDIQSSRPPHLLTQCSLTAWCDETAAAVGRMWESADLSQYVGLELPDFSSRYVNVRDGERRTWQPPTPESCRFRVWMFGGSTLFGIDQRDDHTIASELARAAWADGVGLSVRNFGIPGDSAWQENRRLRRLLARTPAAEHPDLVIFYDGGNDLMYVTAMAHVVVPRPGQVYGDLDYTYMRVLAEMKQRGDDYSADVPAQPWRTDYTTRSAADAVLDQYLAADAEARTELAAAGIPTRRFFQPSQPTRAHDVVGEISPDPDLRSVARQVRARLPDTIVDLAGTYDDVNEPIYTDQIHTVEAATLPIARRILEAIDDQLPSPADESCA